MRRLKYLLFPAMVCLVIAGAVYLQVRDFNEMEQKLDYYMEEKLNGIIVDYDEDEKGPIVVLKDLQSEKLFSFQFVNGVSEEIYGTELKNVIEQKQYDVELLVYYKVAENDSVYEVSMAYIIDDEKH